MRFRLLAALALAAVLQALAVTPALAITVYTDGHKQVGSTHWYYAVQDTYNAGAQYRLAGSQGLYVLERQREHTGPELVASTYRKLGNPRVRRFFVEQKTGGLTDAGVGDDFLAGTDTSGMWTRDPSQRGQLQYVRANTKRTVIPPRMSGHPMAVIASHSENGDLWYLGDSVFEARRFNLRDGAVVSYDLPYQEFGSSTPDTTPWPDIQSTFIDDEGNLWISYVYGYRHVVCLER